MLASAISADECGALELAKACDILDALLAAKRCDSEQLFKVRGAQCELDCLREIHQILLEKIKAFEEVRAELLGS